MEDFTIAILPIAFGLSCFGLGWQLSSLLSLRDIKIGYEEMKKESLLMEQEFEQLTNELKAYLARSSGRPVDPNVKFYLSEMQKVAQGSSGVYVLDEYRRFQSRSGQPGEGN